MNVHFSFIIFYLCLICSCAAAKRLKGPYRTQLQSARKCVKPKPPYITESPPKVKLEIYNTSTRINQVKINATSEQIFRQPMSKIKFYNEDNGKWKLTYMIHTDGCVGWLSIFFKLLELKYDEKHCSIPAGQYFMKDIDPNILDHALTNSKTYGKYLIRIEVYVKTGMLFCYDFITSILPA